MPAEIHCPKCSVNVIFSKKRRVYVCEDCGHEFALEKSAALMRIFLSRTRCERGARPSYKNRFGETRARCWLDKTEIKAGDDWRRAITDGILHSQRVVSFLSKHSTRDPGVCRDEIAIAIGVKGGNIQTILVESEAEVQPPVNIGHIQWLDMHDWRVAHGVVHSEQDKDGNAYAVGDAAWENWYQDKLAEIVRVVESDESQRFAGEKTNHGNLFVLPFEHAATRERSLRQLFGKNEIRWRLLSHQISENLLQVFVSKVMV